MKKLIAALCLTLAVSPLAMAESKGKEAAAPTAIQLAQAKKEPSAKQKAQQQKMTKCSKDAKSKGLKGEKRKAYMKTCLKG